ncbi:MAG: AMP-binding protein [Myxococcales bacterium]|nr:AMP-binding protein [Myxococcales bacterium]
MTDTIVGRLFEQAKKRGAAPAYFAKQQGTWQKTSYSEYAEQVKTAGKALMALGLGKDSKVSILGFNRPEWVIFDLAAMAIGGAPAGIYTTCSPVEVRYIVDHSESPVVLLENVEQWRKIEAEKANLPLLKHAVMMAGAPKIDDPMVLSWEEFLGKAQGVSDEDFFAALEALEPNQLATLIYTSGTTGPPKGVMLSHENLAWTSKVAVEINDTRSSDCSVSYLPLSHIAEAMFTIHAPITAGSHVYFAESIDALPENLKEVQPTVFFGVPRIWEKFHAGIGAKLKEATGVKKSLVEWARGVGARASAERMRGREPSGLLGLQYKLAHKLIFSKLKPAVGLGRARVCVSGAAPISKEILEFFATLDIVIQEVYGQSEDTGPTSYNLSDRAKFGSVGPVLKGCEVKIAEDGEILVKGPNVFLGYFKDADATASTLIDGYLHSGDLGELDSEGFLHITGRKKDIIITAGGKNITPKNIEAAIKNDELVTEAVVIGDRRKFLSALITVDPEAARRVDSSKPAHESESVRQHLQQLVDKVNTQFAKVETIKRFTVLHRQLSIEDGELTPTLKVKRNKVNEHFADEIEAMYAE